MKFKEFGFESNSTDAKESQDYESNSRGEMVGLQEALQREVLNSQELRAALKIVSERVQFLEDIVNNVGVVIFISRLTDYEKGTWEISWANRPHKDILGFTRKEFKDIGKLKHLVENWHEEDYRKIGDYHKWKIENGRTNGLFRRKLKDGETRWIYITVGELNFDKNGNPSEYLGVAVDLTDKIQTEEQLTIVLRENLQLRNQLIANSLTCREKQILIKIGDGLTNRGIAEEFNLSFHTVNSHRKNLLKKLNLKNTAELIKLAVESGLV